MIRFLTAGESHGKALITIAEGFPSNLELSEDYINLQLKRRQGGYGRGARMQIEKDSAEIISGVRYGRTLGSPISLIIKNKDWENWIDEMNIAPAAQKSDPVTIPRPGHADLTGSIKYNFDDIRNSIERSSARETAARVAAGSIARKLLQDAGIEVGSWVESIGGIYNPEFKAEPAKEYMLESAGKVSSRADLSEVRVLNDEQEENIIGKIKNAKKKGDTLGGTFIVAITGAPAGLGSFVHYDRKINASLAMAVMSINGVKGVEIGAAGEAGLKFGSEVHDEIILDENSLVRKTNRAGGIEGGITTGMPIIIRGTMKPISTLMMPLNSVDLKTMQVVESRRERSDFVAVPACAVIAESMAAWVIAEYFLEKFGGDSMEEIFRHYKGYKENTLNQLKSRFLG